MRFVTFQEGGTTRAGVLDAAGEEATVVDLAHPAFAGAMPGTAPDVLALVQAGLAGVAAAIAAVEVPEAARLPLAAVRLLAPIERPPLIIGAAHNFRDAIAERGMEPPAAPVVFIKAPETVVGTGEPIVLPAGIGGVTYEAELAAVIGRAGRDIAAADALDHVAGYAAFNDISASELIKQEGNFLRGKNFPTFAPFGPYLATADEIADPQDVAISLSVDGTALQDGTTATMLFSVAELIAALSREYDLVPGTVIATGTPGGVAPVRKPPTWLRPGTTVTMSVAGLGTLANPVVEGTA